MSFLKSSSHILGPASRSAKSLGANGFSHHFLAASSTKGPGRSHARCLHHVSKDRTAARVRDPRSDHHVRHLYDATREHKTAEERANYPSVGDKSFGQFTLKGRVFVVTGGARGLGLCLASALCEAGGHCKHLQSRHIADHPTSPPCGG